MAKPKTKTSKTILSYLKSLLNVRVVNPLARTQQSPCPYPFGYGFAFAGGSGKHLRRQNVLGKMKSVFIPAACPNPQPTSVAGIFAYFLCRSDFLCCREYAKWKLPTPTVLFSFFFFLLPLLGLPNKLMPFYLFFTNTLRAEQSRTQNSVRSWKSWRLECCHPILRVAQVLERKKLYFIKQTKANFYNFLFNANKSKVAATGWEARGSQNKSQPAKEKKWKKPEKSGGKTWKEGFRVFFFS